MHGTAIKGSHWVMLDFSQFLTEDEGGGDVVVGLVWFGLVWFG